MLTSGFRVGVLIIACAAHRSPESVSEDSDLVSNGTSWQGPKASRVQRSPDTQVSSRLHIQESIGFLEIEFFLFDQVLDEITFVQLIVGTKAFSCVHNVCFVLLIGNLIPKGFELEWIGHRDFLEVLMGI